MRAGFNPTHRNRNAGTGARGHGADNRLVIPESWNDLRAYYERLGSFVSLRREVGPRELRFFVEPARPGWFYPCTVGELCAVLAGCPAEDLAAFDYVVLRQPTRKQSLLASVWGRAVFSFDIAGEPAPAIVLEAQTLEPLVWSASVTPETERELDRLYADGHEIRREARRVVIHPTPAALRNTQLYRTLLHELGHHVDFQRCPDSQWSTRPRAMKEAFAHRYAAERLAALREQGIVPVAPGLEAEPFDEDLQREWFAAADSRVGRSRDSGARGS